MKFAAVSFLLTTYTSVASSCQFERMMSSSVIDIQRHRIEDACANDMELFCPSQPLGGPFPFMPLSSFMMEEPRTLRLGEPRNDPFVQLFQDPFPLLDISFTLDQMMNHALAMEEGPVSSSFTIITVMAPDDDDDDDDEEEDVATTSTTATAPSPKEDAGESEMALDSMVKSLAAAAPVSSVDPIELSKKIMDYGKHIAESDDESDGRRRMARRLTEIDPELFVASHPGNHHHMHHDGLLPFGDRNMCFRDALHRGLLSPSCSHAVGTAKQVVVSSVETETTFYTFAMLYFVLAFFTFAVIAKHFRKMHRRMRKTMELNRRIMAAVYSNPHMKAQVEGAVGSSIGVVPPLHPHILARMGGHAFPRVSFTFRIIRAVILAFILSTVFAVNPLAVMPICCFIMLAQCLRFTWCPPEHPVASCRCCCCSLSTEDVVAGRVSSEQACCTCCGGSGVCAPQCADCCGSNSTSTCDCCQQGCDCCSGGSCPGGTNKKRVVVTDAKMLVYEGVPVTVV